MSTKLIIINLLIGPLLLVLSLIFKSFPPKRINLIYGYRTTRSMKSQEAWEAANKYSTELMMWVSIITTVSQIVLYFFVSPTTSILISCTIMSILLVAMMFVVEKHLKDNF